MSETFIEQAPDLVVSSLGYSVQPLGRTGIRYIDQELDFVIDAEGLIGVVGYSVYTNSIHESGPEVSRILENVQKAFDFLAYKLELI